MLGYRCVHDVHAKRERERRPSSATHSHVPTTTLQAGSARYIYSPASVYLFLAHCIIIILYTRHGAQKIDGDERRVSHTREKSSRENKKQAAAAAAAGRERAAAGLVRSIDSGGGREPRESLTHSPSCASLVAVPPLCVYTSYYI